MRRVANTPGQEQQRAVNLTMFDNDVQAHCQGLELIACPHWIDEWVAWIAQFMAVRWTI